MTEVDFDALGDWLFERALPLWAEHGVDRADGGYYEELDLAAAPTAKSFKRLRTMCRQTYVFSHAAVLGWSRGAELSRAGYDYLCGAARLSDGGWARTLSRNGGVIDDTADLYDLSFVIFAMAWRFRASGDDGARRHALEALSFIQSRLDAPDGGFLHTWPVSGPRVQNPHMHLLEACLAAFEAINDQRFLDVARELVVLFRTKFFDGVSLGEHFDESWRRLASDNLEPGHHFEWVWILAEFSRLSGEDVLPQARALVHFAERHGVNPRTGAVYDRLTAQGDVSRASSRIWPNTERIRAALAMFELAGADPRKPVSQAQRLIQDRYFVGCLPGLWIDQVDGDGRPLTHIVPASCLYHIFAAFRDVLRLKPAIMTIDPQG